MNKGGKKGEESTCQLKDFIRVLTGNGRDT